MDGGAVPVFASLDIPQLAIGFFYRADDTEPAIAGTDIPGSGRNHRPSVRVAADRVWRSERGNDQWNVVIVKDAVGPSTYHLLITSARRNVVARIGDGIHVGKQQQSVVEIRNDTEPRAVESFHVSCL